MKFHHVETQEDYDALMKELSEQGYVWTSGRPLDISNEWIIYESDTVVWVVNDKEVSYSSKGLYSRYLPNSEIITYKTTKKEKILGIPSWAEWLARDKNGELWAYAEKPLKGFDGYVANGGHHEDVKETDDTFKLIRWEDEEPTKIKRGLETGGVNEMTLEQIAQANGMINVTAVTDIINKPNHYVGIQGLEVETVLQNFIPRYTDSYEAHRIASAIEYLLRSPLKNGTEDVKKAKKNIEQVLRYRETQNE